MARKPRYTVAQIAKMQRLRDEGHTLHATADITGASVSFVFGHTVNHHKKPLTDRQKRHRKISDNDIARIEQAWRDLATVEDIADMLDVSKSVVARYIANVPDSERDPAPPKPPRTTTEQNRQLRALEAQTIQEDERRDNSSPRTTMATSAPIEKHLTWEIVHEPIPDRDWDTTGPNPDHDLSLYAQDVIKQWVTAQDRGRIFNEQPMSVIQAIYIYASTLATWDYDQFLQDRGLWVATRAINGINSTDLATRLGISPASISRYESGDRKPPTGTLKNVHNAYTALLEEALVTSETQMALRSFNDWTRNRGRDPETELFEHDLFYRWIAQEQDIEDFSISHIDHLATVRAVLPYPTWREPTPQNLWLAGYPNQPAFATT